MPSIAGFCSFAENGVGNKERCESILLDMKSEMLHRNPFAENISLRFIAMNGKKVNNLAISFAGSIFNKEDLPKGTNEMEIAANTILEYGINGIDRINGVFAGAVYDIKSETLYLFRDHLGIAPLFYTTINDTFVFSSEIRGLFAYPGYSAEIDKNGLCSLFGLLPAIESGSGLLKGVYSVKPGNVIKFDASKKTTISAYWTLKSIQHRDGFKETAANVSFLLKDSIKRQMRTNGKICSFLSGGLDSSVLTAIMANELKREGRKLDTFSFDFTGNDEYFEGNDFQPERDRPYAEKVVTLYNTNHCFLECGNETLYNYLGRALEARGIPGMADVDSSLMFFCDAVKHTNDVALTGECSDEIFAGYPWFHKQELINADMFPWSPDIEARKVLLSDEFINLIDLDGYVRNQYEESVKQTPYLDGETGNDKRIREISFLTLQWFMPTLGTRTERMSALSGLSVCMPFSDKRLVEYVWNVPFAMKSNGGVKGLLIEAAKDLLPDELLNRKKSPFPKTYNPGYEKTLSDKMREIVQENKMPICQFMDKNKVMKFLESPNNYGKPWFGQLMAGPQMLAFMLQVNTWLLKNNVKILN